MKLYKYLHWPIVYLLIALSCAQQTSPTGGPKDTIPPTLIRANPANGQTKVTGETIVLTFDESLVLNTPKEQILITPSVGKDFDATVKKGTVTVRFKNPLKENTTYSINFRESIQDITEKNPAPNLKLAFSTGTYIDSLSIEGYVFDLLRNKEIKDATVGLYQSDTFNIFKHKPEYITKTNDKGLFQITNLKPGSYAIYAMKDNNKNLIVDSRSEAYGFLSKRIELKSNTKGIKIGLINLDTRPLKLTSARPSGNFFNIKLSKALKSFKITHGENGVLLSSYGADHENVRVYNTLEITDSLAIHFTAQDSVLHKIDTTVYAKFVKRDLKPEAFKISNSLYQVSASKGELTGSITFNKPLADINFDSLYYRIDSANFVRITRQDIAFDSAQNILTFKKNFDKKLLIKPPPPATKPNVPREPKQTMSKEAQIKALKAKPKIIENQFYTGKHTYLSVDADSSKKSEQIVQPITLESTGIIFVEAKTKDPNYIIQLVSKEDKVIASSANTPKVTFDDLQPADYKIRLVIDSNKDGEWSPGNYLQQIEPEQIIFYKNEKGLITVNLKANWELGPLLITY